MMTTTGMNVEVIFTEDLTAIDTREVTEGTVSIVMIDIMTVRKITMDLLLETDLHHGIDPHFVIDLPIVKTRGDAWMTDVAKVRLDHVTRRKKRKFLNGHPVLRHMVMNLFLIHDLPCSTSHKAISFMIQSPNYIMAIRKKLTFVMMTR